MGGSDSKCRVALFFLFKTAAKAAPVDAQRAPGAVRRNDVQHASALDSAARRFGASAVRATFAATGASTRSGQGAPPYHRLCRIRRRGFTARLGRTTARTKVFVRVPHLLKRRGRRFLEHLVHVGMQLVYPTRQRVAAREDGFAVFRRFEIVYQVVAAFAAREHVAKAVEEGLVLTLLDPRWAHGIVQRHGVQYHPQAWSPYGRQEAVGAAEIRLGEG